MIEVIQSNHFKKKFKKYDLRIQNAIIESAKIIRDNRLIGEKKKGDLVDYYVYKFKINRDLYLLAYRNISKEIISLEAIGTHENFYKNLKRVSHLH